MPGGCRETTPCVLAGSKYSVDSCAACAFVVDLKVSPLFSRFLKKKTFVTSTQKAAVGGKSTLKDEKTHE